MGRRRFAHLSDAGDEIYVDANIPWGSTTLFTLEFRDDSRLYAVHTANNRYLSRDGRLLEQCTATCLFSLEYHAGALALRDTQGLYLAPLGSKVCCFCPHNSSSTLLLLLLLHLTPRPYKSIGIDFRSSLNSHPHPPPPSPSSVFITQGIADTPPPLP